MHNSSGALPVCDWQKAGMLSCQAAMLSIAAWQKAAKLLCFMNNSSGGRKGTKNTVAGTEGKSSRGSEIHVTLPRMPPWEATLNTPLGAEFCPRYTLVRPRSYGNSEFTPPCPGP